MCLVASLHQMVRFTSEIHRLLGVVVHHRQFRLKSRRTVQLSRLACPRWPRTMDMASQPETIHTTVRSTPFSNIPEDTSFLWWRQLTTGEQDWTQASLPFFNLPTSSRRTPVSLYDMPPHLALFLFWLYLETHTNDHCRAEIRRRTWQSFPKGRHSEWQNFYMVSVRITGHPKRKQHPFRLRWWEGSRIEACRGSECLRCHYPIQARSCRYLAPVRTVSTARWDPWSHSPLYVCDKSETYLFVFLSSEERAEAEAAKQEAKNNGGKWPGSSREEECVITFLWDKRFISFAL